jgi:hypothetical protein
MCCEQKLAKNGFKAAQKYFSLPGGAGIIMTKMKPLSFLLDRRKNI